MLRGIAGSGAVGRPQSPSLTVRKRGNGTQARARVVARKRVRETAKTVGRMWCATTNVVKRERGVRLTGYNQNSVAGRWEAQRACRENGR